MNNVFRCKNDIKNTFIHEKYFVLFTEVSSV